MFFLPKTCRSRAPARAVSLARSDTNCPLLPSSDGHGEVYTTSAACVLGRTQKSALVRFIIRDRVRAPCVVAASSVGALSWSAVWDDRRHSFIDASHRPPSPPPPHRTPYPLPRHNATCRCKQCLVRLAKTDVLRLGIVGMRGSMVLRPRPCTILTTPAPPKLKLRFRVGNLDLLERRKRYTSSREEDVDACARVAQQ